MKQCNIEGNIIFRNMNFTMKTKVHGSILSLGYGLCSVSPILHVCRDLLHVFQFSPNYKNMLGGELATLRTHMSICVNVCV